TAFTSAWREHDEREERRLAYVAVTRPRRLLLASGYWWGDAVKRPRGPSVFLDEIRATCLDGAGTVDEWAPEPAADATNPSAELVATAEWPMDPLGPRRPAMAAAADLIRRMLTAGDPEAATAFADLAESTPDIADRAALAADLVGMPEGDPVPGKPDTPGPRRHPEAPAPASTASTASTDDARPGLGRPDEARPDEARPDDARPAPAEVDPVIARWRREATLLLAEREERARHDGPIEVAVPAHLSVSQLVILRRDPQGLARSLRRPLPHRPAPFARRGTAFHAWLEQRFGSIRLLDLDELPGAADDGAAPDEELAALQQAFLDGEWADRTPVEVEVPFATTVAGVVIRGRMDAVYADPGGRYDVIDWKTGRRPEGQAAAAAAIQLAAYRIAWCSLAGVPPARVRAGFHYVKEGVTVRPADLLDAEALAALIAEIPEQRPR
ncbi:MAG: ATP-dependent helicase UvrD/PcrA, partial [Actinoplanes sp.]|nr:ATP-dependent helicase UvrD/PcrA [Actinoplanes sp.]